MKKTFSGKELTMATKKRLAKVFTYTGEQEQQLEFARQNLCKASAFEPYASFQRLDRLSKGDNGIDTADETDAKFVIKYFDSTAEGRLGYTDYLQLLLPCDQPYLRAAATQRPTYPVPQSEFLPFEVERLLAKLVQKELKLARESERLKQELAARYDFNIEQLYREVDDFNYKYIDAQNLKRFLIKTGVYPNDQLLIAILRRFDLDADAKLTFKEFSEGVQPQQDYSKRQLKEKETLATSRVLSANRNGNKSFRSASKGGNQRSAIKDNKSLSRNALVKSSHQKQRSISRSAKSNRRQTTQNDQQYSTLQIKSDEDNLQYRSSTITSPAQKSDVYPREHSPLRMKALTEQNQPLTQSAFKNYESSALQKSIVSPGKASYQHLRERGGDHDDNMAKSYMSEASTHNTRGRENNNKSTRNDDGEIDGSLIYLIRECFKEIIAIEGGLEQVKKEIAVRSDFTLAGAFNMFTGYSQARITANELLFGLERLGVNCDIADCKLFVERFDADKDGKLGFWEFSNALMPIDTILRDDLERRKAVWEIGFETKDLLRRVFRKLIDAECMLEALRQRISRENGIQLRKAFDALDWLGRGFLTNNEFKRAFENVGQRISNASLHSSTIYKSDQLVELEGFIRRFNKDKLNGRISLPEFLEELTPKCAEKPY